MAVNEFVLVDIPKYAGEWPQLCKIVSICNALSLLDGTRGPKPPLGRRAQGEHPGARENRTVVGDNIQVADMVVCVPANTVWTFTDKDKRRT